MFGFLLLGHSLLPSRVGSIRAIACDSVRGFIIAWLTYRFAQTVTGYNGRNTDDYSSVFRPFPALNSLCMKYFRRAKR
jgi:hypothetical protein